MDDRLGSGGGDWAALSMATTATTATAQQPPPHASSGAAGSFSLMASPQATSKLSLEDLLTRFGGGHVGVPDISVDSIYEQLTGGDEERGAGVALTAATAVEEEEEEEEEEQRPLRLQSRSHALAVSQLEQEEPRAKKGTGGGDAARKMKAARQAAGSDVIPVATLRPLHDQHLTTSIKAVYQNGRPIVVPIPDGSPEAAAALGIESRHGCQVLVEFKRKRVLQYESNTYVSPGSYVMVGGDRGEDLGLVTYTWCEVRSRENADGEASGSGKSKEGIRDSLLGAKIIHNGSSDVLERNGKGTASESQSITNGGVKKSVIGIGLTGSSLTRSIGVGSGTVLRLASEKDTQQLHGTQTELEQRAIDVCAQRVLERELSMVIVDAEYQFDKKKLTFFYQAQQRLDFRDLVRDLFKTFRARIWMELVEM